MRSDVELLTRGYIELRGQSQRAQRRFRQESVFRIALPAPIGYPCSVTNVGEQLRKAREARNLGIHEVAEITKIRGDHLRALEEGNYSVFSAPVYIRGFVRTYSTLLKLDTAQILAQLGRELADSGQVDPMLARKKQSILDFAMFQLSKFSGRMVWPVAGTAAVLLVIMGGWFLWSHHRNGDPTAGLGDGLYQWPADSGDTLPLPVIKR